MLPFSITAALVCDDVRREVGGKATLVGVSGGIVRVDSFPFETRFCLYLQIVPTETANHPGAIRIVGPHEAVLVQGPTVGRFKSGAMTTVVFQDLVVQIQSPGELKFQMKFEPSEDWDTIREIDIRLREPPKARESDSERAMAT